MLQIKSIPKNKNPRRKSEGLDIGGGNFNELPNPEPDHKPGSWPK